MAFATSTLGRPACREFAKSVSTCFGLDQAGSRTDGARLHRRRTEGNVTERSDGVRDAEQDHGLRARPPEDWARTVI